MIVKAEVVRRFNRLENGQHEHIYLLYSVSY